MITMGKHSEWRKAAKKAHRKRIRQTKAKIRDQLEKNEIREREKCPLYQTRIAKQEEEKRLYEENEKCLALARQKEYEKVEAEAQERFRELQQKLAFAKEERAKQNEKIREEWHKQQEQQRLIDEQLQIERQNKIKQQAILDAHVEDFLISGGDTPEHLKGTLETNPNKTVCTFFAKTGACRFFDSCSRNHIRPKISRILVISNFFSHISLETAENEHGTDSTLEFEHDEIYRAYRDFFYDVIEELEKFGPIIVFKTCCNREPHLRGNVYVEFSETWIALKCFRQLNGRWYGGKQIGVQFASIPSWKSAICGLDFSSKCPKGSCCNFLHVFRNPRNLYNRCDNEQRNRSTRECRWSESPERLQVGKEKSSSHKSSNRKKQRNSPTLHSRQSQKSPDSERSRVSSKLQDTRWSESPRRQIEDYDIYEYARSKLYSGSSRRKYSTSSRRSSHSQKSTKSRSRSPDNYKRCSSRSS